MGLVNMFFARSGETLAHIGPLPITTGGLMVAVLYSCRLALVIILGAVFLATTTPTAMTDAFGSLLMPFRKIGWHTQEVALVMSLALRFLPTLSDETKAIIDVAIGPRRHDRDRFAGHSCQSAVRHHRADPCGGAASRG